MDFFLLLYCESRTVTDFIFLFLFLSEIMHYYASKKLAMNPQCKYLASYDSILEASDINSGNSFCV